MTALIVILLIVIAGLLAWVLAMCGIVILTIIVAIGLAG